MQLRATHLLTPRGKLKQRLRRCEGQHVEFIRNQYNLTFTLTDQGNRPALLTNQRAGFGELGNMAKNMIDLITTIPK